MADRQSLEQLIAEHRGVLVRSKKHRIYRFPNGVVFTVASTPRCPRAYANAITELKRLLGLNDPDRGQPGNRRDRKSKRLVGNQQRWIGEQSIPPRLTWQDQLEAVRKHL